MGGSALDKLSAAEWMLTIRQARKVFILYFTDKTPLCGQFAVPLAANVVALGVVIVLRVGKLLAVIAARLTGTERLGNGQHGSRYCASSIGSCCSCCCVVSAGAISWEAGPAGGLGFGSIGSTMPGDEAVLGMNPWARGSRLLYGM